MGRKTLLFVGTLLGAAACAHAAELSDLDQSLPLSIEDTQPSGTGDVDFQGIARYQRMRSGENGRNEFQVDPRIQAGVAENLQLSMELPYRIGNASDTSQGDLQFDALYRLSRESDALPSFAIAGSLGHPYGAARGGTEVGAKWLATRTVGGSSRTADLRQIHINLGWRHNFNPGEGERNNRYLAGVAYSQLLSERWLAGLSYFREQERESSDASNMAELGFRWKRSKDTILTATLGHGFNEAAPRWRLLLGFQTSLNSLFGRR